MVFDSFLIDREYYYQNGCGTNEESAKMYRLAQ